MIAAGIYAGLALVVALFQMALALGAPWGHLAMGGRWPGRFAWPLRLGAVAQGGLIVAMARVVAGQGGLLAPVGPPWLIWGVVAISALSAVANLATPSRAERRLWGPVTVAMLVACLFVALG